MKPMVLYYAKCSTCQKALKWLEEKGIAYEGRPIKEENPTAAELKEWQVKSGLPLKRFFNRRANKAPLFKRAWGHEIISGHNVINAVQNTGRGIHKSTVQIKYNTTIIFHVMMVPTHTMTALRRSAPFAF